MEAEGAFHGSPVGGERAEAGVFEGLSGEEAWLLADDAFAADDVLFGVGVDDDPVSGHESCGGVGGVGDGDVVGEDEDAAVFV